MLYFLEVLFHSKNKNLWKISNKRFLTLDHQPRHPFRKHLLLQRSDYLCVNNNSGRRMFSLTLDFLHFPKCTFPTSLVISVYFVPG